MSPISRGVGIHAGHDTNRLDTILVVFSRIRRLPAATSHESPSRTSMGSGHRRVTLRERRIIMHDYPPPVDRLLSLGKPDQTHEVISYQSLGLAPDHIPQLIQMATDRELSLADAESLTCGHLFTPGMPWEELRAEEAVRPLLDELDFLVANDDDWAPDALPKVFAKIGPAAIPELTTFLTDPTKQFFARVAIPVALEYMALNYPDTREECVAVLTKILAEAEWNDPELNGFIICALIDMEAVESASIIEGAFADGLVDYMVAGDWDVVRADLGLAGPPGRAMVRYPDFLLPRFEIYHADPLHTANARSRKKLAASWQRSRPSRAVSGNEYPDFFQDISTYRDARRTRGWLGPCGCCFGRCHDRQRERPVLHGLPIEHRGADAQRAAGPRRSRSLNAVV